MKLYFTLHQIYICITYYLYFKLTTLQVNIKRGYWIDWWLYKSTNNTFQSKKVLNGFGRIASESVTLFGTCTCLFPVYVLNSCVVASCMLRVASCELRVVRCALRVACCVLVYVVVCCAVLRPACLLCWYAACPFWGHARRNATHNTQHATQDRASYKQDIKK